MSMPEATRKAVVYLGHCVRKGSVELFYLAGTGFLVGVPSKGSHNRSYVYLVTAKHVARAFEGKPFLMRANNNNGAATNSKMNQGDEWWLHPTEADNVDAAVINVPPMDNLDVEAIPTSMFLTDDVIEERSIGPGDEVFVVGVFSRAPGKSRNMPIVRTGNIALMPDNGEKIPNVTICGLTGDAEAYLIESRSLGGLSGSPAFVRETVCYPNAFSPSDPSKPRLFYGHGAFYLMGLMHGHWFISGRDNNEIAPDPIESKHPEANIIGVSVVVPAKKILEILNQDALVERRRDSDNKYQHSLGHTSTD